MLDDAGMRQNPVNTRAHPVPAGPSSLRRRFSAAARLACLGLASLLFARALVGDDVPPAPFAPHPVDATTLQGKVLCGYQGWFRCPGDPADVGWRHWSRNGRTLTPDTLTFEMWPEMTEYPRSYPAPGFEFPDGQPATLFSSADAETVDLHFSWMRDYGLDGVFLQRFLVSLNDPSTDLVLEHVRAAARRTGRTFALCYDLTGARSDRIVEQLARDWRELVQVRKLTGDEHYLHHQGRPVLFIWGFFSDRFPAEAAHRLIDAVQAEDAGPVWLIGGCQWYWRNERNADWARAFRRLNAISPWNVGNVSIVGDVKHAATGYWRDDCDAARQAGMDYLPVLYPGFGWINLKGADAARHTIPRRSGEFFWEQFEAAAQLGLDTAYVAMFDEVDEATAVFKVTNAPPTPGRFETYEGLPPDWYLRLTREGTRLLRGERSPDLGRPQP